MIINNKHNMTIISNIFYFFNLISLARLFNQSIKAGIISSVLIIILLILNFRKIKITKRNINFYIFIIINLMSISSYLYNDLDIYLYFAGISYNLIPSLLYILGMIYAQNSTEYFLNKILLSNMVILGIGMILFISRPSFYSAFLADNSYYRMLSYLGSSMQIGNISAISIPLLFANLKKFGRVQNSIFFIITFIGLMLSMQRSAWIAGLIALVLSLMIYYNKNLSLKKLISLYSIFFILIIIIPIVFMTVVPVSFQGHVLRRFDTFDISMFTSRTNQWESAIDIFLEYPLGYGLGSAGHKSATLGLSVVPDGNYFRILVETGIFGILTFSGFNIQGLKSSWQKNKYLFVILIIYLLQAIGTNVFDLMYSSFIYWFILGYIINVRLRYPLWVKPQLTTKN